MVEAGPESCVPASTIAVMEPILSDITVCMLLSLREYTKNTLTEAMATSVSTRDMSRTPDMRERK